MEELLVEELLSPISQRSGVFTSQFMLEGKCGSVGYTLPPRSRGQRRSNTKKRRHILREKPAEGLFKLCLLYIRLCTILHYTTAM